MRRRRRAPQKPSDQPECRRPHSNQSRLWSGRRGHSLITLWPHQLPARDQQRAASALLPVSQLPQPRNIGGTDAGVVLIAGLPSLEPCTLVGRKGRLLVLIKVRTQDRIGGGEIAIQLRKLGISAYPLLVGIDGGVAVEGWRLAATEKKDGNCRR